MKPPYVEINNSKWHIKNGLRLTVNTYHTTVDGKPVNGRMYSVVEAKNLANELLRCCETVEAEPVPPVNSPFKSFLKRKLNIN